MLSLAFIGILILGFGIAMAIWLWHPVDDGGIGGYHKTAAVSLVVSFALACICWIISSIYNDFDEMILRIKHDDYICIDLPAEDFQKFGIDLSKDKPFIIKHYYIIIKHYYKCSNSHAHDIGSCNGHSILCYRAYFSNSIADKYNMLVSDQIESSK